MNFVRKMGRVTTVKISKIKGHIKSQCKKLQVEPRCQTLALGVVGVVSSLKLKEELMSSISLHKSSSKESKSFSSVSASKILR